MKERKLYSIQRFIVVVVVASTLALIVVVFALGALGFGSKSTLRVVIVWFPFCIFSGLYGFYKGLVKHYGFDGNLNLFFGGRF